MPRGGTKKQKKRNADKGSHGFNGRDFEVQKAINGDRGSIVFTAALISGKMGPTGLG